MAAALAPAAATATKFTFPPVGGITVNGLIDTHGGTAGDGGAYGGSGGYNGGNYCSYYGNAGSVELYGTSILTGTITATGGKGGNATAGGARRLRRGWRLHRAGCELGPGAVNVGGAIDTSGGAGGTGNGGGGGSGGEAGEIEMYGNSITTSTITAKGGDGGDDIGGGAGGSGGEGGHIELEASYGSPGTVNLGGAIDASGGAGGMGSGAGGGTGGYAGEVYAEGISITTSTTITTRWRRATTQWEAEAATAKRAVRSIWRRRTPARAR